MSREKVLVKNMFLYMIGNFASKFLGFILLPFYTHYLSTKDYGYYDLISSAVLIAVPIITFQLNDAIYRYLLDAETELKRSQIVSNALIITLRNVLFFILLTSAAFKIYPIDYGYLIVILIITTVFSNMWQIIARGLKYNLIYSVSGVVYTFVMLISNIILIIFFNMKVDALIYSSIISSSVVVVYIEWNIRILKLFSKKHKLKELQTSLIKLSMPLLPNSISWLVMSYSDRYIVNIFLGASENGIYAIANKFPSIIFMLNNIFYLAWQESAITEFNSKDKDQFYTQMFNNFMKIQFSILLVILPFTKLFLKFIVDDKFLIAWKYIPFLYIGVIFHAFSLFYGTGYLSSKHTIGAFTTSIYGAVVNLGISIALVPVIGLQAASISTMVSYLVMWLCRIYQTRRYFKIHIDVKQFSLLAALSCLFVVLYFYGNSMISVLMLFSSILLCYIFNRTLMIKGIDFFKKRLKPLSSN